MARLTAVRTLIIGGIADPADLKIVATLPELRSLRIHTAGPDVPLAALADAPKVRSLTVGFGKLGNERPDVPRFAGLTRLEHLSLPGAFEYKDLDAIAGLI